MKYILNAKAEGHDALVLSRRNLLALLEKLDDPQSFRTVSRPSEDNTRTLWITAEEDDVHYGERTPGPMYTNGAYK